MSVEIRISCYCFSNCTCLSSPLKCVSYCSLAKKYSGHSVYLILTCCIISMARCPPYGKKPSGFQILAVLGMIIINYSIRFCESNFSGTTLVNKNVCLICIWTALGPRFHATSGLRNKCMLSLCLCLNHDCSWLNVGLLNLINDVQV